MTAPEYRRYHTSGQDEFCLCFGAGLGRQILIIPPLFDEMNRMRRVLVSAMRHLAADGVGSVLIDLPGCHESQSHLETQSLTIWQQAVSDCTKQQGITHMAAVRGGALVDNSHPHLPHWRLASVKGASLLKTMIRTRIAGEKEAGNSLTEAELRVQSAQGPIALAGNVLGTAMVVQLDAAEPAPLPLLSVRKLGEDIIGSPLWLRAEPQDDPDFAANIASDLARWSLTCG